MERIGNIDYLAPEPIPQQVEPGKLEKVACWHDMLKQVYNMRELNEGGVIVWASVLGDCDNKTMLRVIKDWIKQEEKAPKPSNLLHAYKLIEKPKKAKHKYIAGEEVVACPYCKDTGYIIIIPSDKYETAIPCNCSDTDVTGNLYKALHDPEYRWQDGKFVFRGWVGDD